MRSGNIHGTRCPFEERRQHQGPVSGTGGTAHGTCQRASLLEVQRSDFSLRRGFMYLNGTRTRWLRLVFGVT